MKPAPRLSDRLAVLSACSAALGALHPAPWTLGAAAVVAASILLRRRSLGLLPLVVALLASGLAQRSLDGLDGTPARVVAADVTLVSDPVPSFGGLRVDVRLGGRRLEARAERANVPYVYWRPSRLPGVTGV